MFTPQEIEAMIRATGGVPVVVGAVSTWGHRDLIDRPVLEDGAEVLVEVDTVKVATGILPALSRGTAITVDGEALEVAEHRRVEDGAQTLIELEVA
jgi:hypothetical protein